MIKRAIIFIVFAILALGIGWTQNIMTGTYLVRFTKVEMRQKEKPLPAGSYPLQLSKEQDGGYKIEMKMPKLGKMPGSLFIMAEHIYPDFRGSFSQVVKKALCMKMLFTHKYDAVIDGKIEGNRIKFVLKTTKATYLGVDVNAVVGLEGKLKRQASSDE